MRRARLDTRELPKWLAMNEVQLNGAKICRLTNGMGSGIVSTVDTNEHGFQFLRIPPNLVLNYESVWSYAKYDRHLREVLEASGEFAQTPRGAILIFLLVQVTSSSPDVPAKIGVSNPWSDYVKFIPDESSLPIFWNESERQCLWGTSLKNHVEAKLKALDREFDELREATADIEWCNSTWWDPKSGCLDIRDWKVVDAMWRSRAMDFDEFGLCLVPVMDMANHRSIDRYKAVYAIDESSKEARLTLEHGMSVRAGGEITILYGVYRGAADSVFSYGFIEEQLTEAQSIFLGHMPPPDDPLALAKVAALDLKPGFQVYKQQSSDLVSWSGPFVWAMCVNEEDGLDIQVAVKTDGEKELSFFWKGTEVKDQFQLEGLLRADRLWDLYQLRASSMVRDRISNEISALERLNSRPSSEKIPQGISPNSKIWKISQRLRILELDLLIKAETSLDNKIAYLFSREEVERWLRGRTTNQIPSVPPISDPSQTNDVKTDHPPASQSFPASASLREPLQPWVADESGENLDPSWSWSHQKSNENNTERFGEEGPSSLDKAYSNKDDHKDEHDDDFS